METFSALLAICAGNSPVPGEFPTQRPVTRSFDVYFDLRPNKWLSKQSWGWWFETLSCSLWRHRNDIWNHWYGVWLNVGSVPNHYIHQFDFLLKLESKSTHSLQQNIYENVVCHKQPFLFRRQGIIEATRRINIDADMVAWNTSGILGPGHKPHRKHW